MMVLVTFTVGLVIWIVGWAIGVKPFDAFMITILLTLIAATARIMMPFVNKFLKP
jgi:hypothetical protein